jgi:thiamine pyrophosphate-dependent acetolactate synthase large subunit-like protein
MYHLGWALGAAVGYKMATGKDVIASCKSNFGDI